MASTFYDIGDQVRLSALFTNAAGVGTNPTKTLLLVRAPDSDETEPTIVSDGNGAYHYDLSLDEAGKWHWRWVGTGTVETASEGELVVRRSAFEDPMGQPPP